MKCITRRVTTLRKQKQAGFIQAALLFGIALMTAILGGFALANRTPTSQTDSEQAKVNASVILKQASDLRDGVARYASDNGASSIDSTMNFTAAGVAGLFNPTAGYASPQIMPSSVFDSTALAASKEIKAPTAASAGHWYLNKGTPGNELATAAADPMVILPEIRLDVCQRINNILYGDAISATPGASGGALADWVTLTGADGDLVGPDIMENRPEGCVATSDSKYVYFKAVQER